MEENKGTTLPCTWEQVVRAGILLFSFFRGRNSEFHSTLYREINLGVSNVLCMPQQLSIGTVLLCKLNKSWEGMSVGIVKQFGKSYGQSSK